MRKCEQAMLDAIKSRQNTAVGNTSVSDGSVYLFGNHLGDWDYDLDIFCVNLDTLKTYPTQTTLSRLRALGVDVHTRKGVVSIGSERVA